VGTYDVAVPWRAKTVNEVAEVVAECLKTGDSSAALRVAFRFVEHYDKADWDTRRRITAQPPSTTGSDRFDALLAGIVEYSCATHQAVAPSWVDEDRFFLSQWWFVSGVASLHANALVHSPISLARRGVFVTQGALNYA